MSTTAMVPAVEEGAAEGAPRVTPAREEALSVGLTSLAAVLTARSAFQASTWSGVQTFALARANKLRQEWTEARLEGDQQSNLDINLFVAFAAAYSEDRAEYAAFLRQRFPRRLEKATSAWLETRPFASADAPPHPFAMAEYDVAAHRRARELAEQADAAALAGAHANRIADIYVLGTVVLAMVMLIASLSSKLEWRRVRRASLGVSALALLVALAWLATRPVASPGVTP